jgi:hypothetical protein
MKMNFFRNKPNTNDSLKSNEIIEDDNIKKSQSINTRDIKYSTIIQNMNIIEHHHGAHAFVDQRINDEIELIRKSRFFIEFDTARSSLALARNLVEGELSGGSDDVKSRALAWCARLLSTKGSELEEAEEYLKSAKVLGNCPEIEIAYAFIISQKGDKNVALSILAGIDSPLSRSAALMIVANHEGHQVAIDWLKTANIDPKDMDSDGKKFLLGLYLQLSHWEDAYACVDALTDIDLHETPVLYHLVAITNLISTVPNEFRTVVLDQLPFDGAGFPLASDATSIEARRKAHNHFVAASGVAKHLHFPIAAALDDEYALWLELRDPDESEKGGQRLEAKLQDPQSALRLVNLGLQFGIKIDLEAVEREIERQIALHGGITQDAAIARFALAFTKKTPEEVANYIAQHRDELAKYIDNKLMQFFQIEMLSKAGLPERAKECLDILVREGLSEAEESRLRTIIAEAEGTNPIDARKEQFKKSNSLSDLFILVDELEASGDWDGLCEFGEILFKRTNALHDAERLARAFANLQKNERVVEFLKTNSGLLTQSKNLQMIYCWSLYYEGALLEARSELSKLSDEQDNPNYRSLHVNLGIAMGDWNSLVSFVADEYQDKDKRSARELIDAAQLALRLNSPHAKDLILSAVAKGNDDAGILATSYFLATSAGWEENKEVFEWLNKAALLSGEDGPIQRKTLKDIQNVMPDWERRETETWQLLGRGEIPMFLAAQLLNRSLIHMMLFPAFANLSENDPRRRSVVPAYSGKRQPGTLKIGGTVAMDATVLLTLSLLDLLDKALEAFDTVYLAHSTLSWLFEEKQKAVFHQPSRFRGASQIQHFIAKGILEKLIAITVPDSELSEQVGDELALLISEAEKKNDDDTQRIVVRSSPVHRLASLMEEEADLTDHATVLSSCRAIIEKLRQKGQITSEEEKKALVYLQFQEKQWPNQPELADKAILYLDDLTVTHFLHLGVIEKLKAAGFRLIVSPRAVSEANELISYEGMSNKIIDTIERIRSAINTNIESGKIKVGKRHKIVEPEKQSIFDFPTVGLIALASDCDAIIADDRFFNQHNNIDDGRTRAPIFSTIDLLDALAIAGTIMHEDLSECRTLLRRAGYCFIPLNSEELTYHLSASPVKDGKVIETAELRAIRESILRVRMTTWLQLPQEVQWLDALIKTFIRVLHGLWKNGVSISDIQARSKWILNQIDVRGWAHAFSGEAGDNIAKTGHVIDIVLMLSPPIEELAQIKDEYWSWIEETVITPIKEEYPALYSLIIEWYRRLVADITDKDNLNGDCINPYVKLARANAALKILPQFIRTALLEDDDFRKEYGVTADAVVCFSDDVYFQRSDLFSAVREFLAVGLAKEIIDKNGQKWKLENISGEGELPALALSRGEQRFILPSIIGFSPGTTTRLLCLDKAASDVNLPNSSLDKWRNILSEHTLEDDEVDAFYSEFQDTPTEWIKSIRSQIINGFSAPSLVPTSRRYFERLVGVYDGSASICDYAVGNGRAFFKQLSEWRPYEGFLFSLFLSAHSALTTEVNVDHLDSEELIRAFEFLDKHGDTISQLGAIEVGLRIVPSRPELETIFIHLIEQIRDDDCDGQHSCFKLISALFILVDGELSRKKLFTSEPPFYRRLAALSHAALIHSQLANSGIDIDSFSEWALNNRGEQYYFQSLADMRIEPLWDPNLVAAKQIKAEFFGRITNTARIYEQNIKDSKLFDLILGDSSTSLQSLCKFPYPFYPGPLEGAQNNPIRLPAEICDAIATQLSAEEVTPSSFIALVYSARIFRIDANQADLAVKALRLGNHRLANVDDKSQLLAILNGLATVAAITRNSALADELRNLVRRYRYDAKYTLSIEDAVGICLVASASRTVLKDWRDFVGDWLTELAFGNLTDDGGKVLYSSLQYLCNVVPELWVSCGRAGAALKAYIMRM